MPATDPLSETKACDLLARLFRSRGYAVTRNIPFREYGVSFHIDGWDPKARVGFEFLTSEDEDHDDLTLGEYKTLMDAQQRGELSLFIVDEVEPLSVADLSAAVEDFLDEVAEALAARRVGRRATKKVAARKTAVRPRVARRAQPTKAAPAKQALAKKKVAKKKMASRPGRPKKKARRRG